MSEPARLKIGLFAATLPMPGIKVRGVDYVVHRLANELADKHEVTVFSLTPAPLDAKYRHKQLFDNLTWLKQGRRKLLKLTVVPFLLNFVDFSQFDVLHLHGDDWFYFRRRIPTIRTMHGSALHEAQSASSLRRKIVQRMLVPLEYLSRYLATITLAIGKETAKLYRIDSIIDNGVDPNVFFSGKKSEYPMVLYVGTWQGRKRGKFMYNAFLSYVLPKLPQARLYMVSDYCPNHSGVVFEKFPSDERLAQLYRESWVFANPSIYEGFGVTYLEALASSTAVLTSANQGALYVLDGGIYGEIVDDQSFGPALLALLNEPDKRRLLVSRGLERAAKFTWTKVAEQHVAFYRKAMDRQNKLPASAGSSEP